MTDNPCMREATEKRFVEESKPSVCPEHLVLGELSEEAHDLLVACDAIDKWIRETVAEETSSELERIALNMRDEAHNLYAHIATEVLSAKLVADEPSGGEPDKHLSLAGAILRADALATARTILEDSPEESLPKMPPDIDRWIVIDALAKATTAASEEASRYRRSAGL